MKIIQSFAAFDEGSPYLRKGDKKNNILLNFYCFLLSYLTLNKYYGNITMYCNNKAYDLFIKHIPYDEIIIKENKNDFENWNLYKIDSMRLVNDDFIHIDSDVFIFDDLFKPFIENENYKIIIQDVLSEKRNIISNYFNDNKEYYNNVGFNNYDKRCFSCGTFGMKLSIQSDYFEHVDKIIRYMDKINFHSPIKTMVYEELTAYLIWFNKKEKWDYYDILSYDVIDKYGVEDSGNKFKYTHMWFNSKFKDENIALIKNKIKIDFPNQYHLVEKYDKDIMKL